MPVDPMTALAMTGATTIVAAMATSTWQVTRAGSARLPRGAPGPGAIFPASGSSSS